MSQPKKKSVYKDTHGRFNLLIIVGLTIAVGILLSRRDFSQFSLPDWLFSFWFWVILIAIILFFTLRKKLSLKTFWEKNKPKVSWRWLPVTLLILLFLAGIFFLTPVFRSWFTPSNENRAGSSSSAKEMDYENLNLSGRNEMAAGKWFKFTGGYDDGKLLFDLPNKKGHATLHFEKSEDASRAWILKIWYVNQKKFWSFDPGPPPPETLVGTTYVNSEEDAVVIVTQKK